MKRKYKIKKLIPEFLFNNYIDRNLYSKALAKDDINFKYNESEYEKEKKNLKKIFRKHLFGYTLYFEKNEYESNLLSRYREMGVEKLYKSISEDIIINGLFYYLVENIENDIKKNDNKPGFLYCFKPLFGEKDLTFTFNNWEDSNLDIYTIHPFMTQKEQLDVIKNEFIDKVENNCFCIVSFEKFEKSKVYVKIKPFSIMNYLNSVVVHATRKLYQRPSVYAQKLDIVGFDIIDSERNRLIDVTNQNDVGSINSYLFSSNFVVNSSPNFTFKLPTDEEIKDQNIIKKTTYRCGIFTDALNNNKKIENVYKQGFYNYDNYIFYTQTDEIKNLNSMRSEDITNEDRMRWRFESCFCGSGSVRERCRIRDIRRNRGFYTQLWEPAKYMSFKVHFDILEQLVDGSHNKIISGYVILSITSLEHIKRESYYDKFRMYEIQNERDKIEVYSKLTEK